MRDMLTLRYQCWHSWNMRARRHLLGSTIGQTSKRCSRTSTCRYHERVRACLRDYRLAAQHTHSRHIRSRQARQRNLSCRDSLSAEALYARELARAAGSGSYLRAALYIIFGRARRLAQEMSYVLSASAGGGQHFASGAHKRHITPFAFERQVAPFRENLQPRPI